LLKNHRPELSSSHPTAETRFPASSARGVLSLSLSLSLFYLFAGWKKTINNGLIDLKFEIQLAESSMVLCVIVGWVGGGGGGDQT
jgi:hypothetical protein